LEKVVSVHDPRIAPPHKDSEELIVKSQKRASEIIFYALFALTLIVDFVFQCSIAVTAFATKTLMASTALPPVIRPMGVPIRWLRGSAS
jgi:hypothetical protein